MISLELYFSCRYGWSLKKFVLVIFCLFKYIKYIYICIYIYIYIYMYIYFLYHFPGSSPDYWTHTFSVKVFRKNFNVTSYYAEDTMVL